MTQKIGSAYVISPIVGRSTSGVARISRELGQSLGRLYWRLSSPGRLLSRLGRKFFLANFHPSKKPTFIIIGRLNDGRVIFEYDHTVCVFHHFIISNAKTKSINGTRLQTRKASQAKIKSSFIFLHKKFQNLRRIDWNTFVNECSGQSIETILYHRRSTISFNALERTKRTLCWTSRDW